MATYKAKSLVMPNGDEFVPDENVFVAEYGVTPYAEVQAAENAGKVLFCIRGGFVYSYADFEGSYEFWLQNNTGTLWVSVNSSNNWMNGSYKNTAYSKTNVSPNSNYAIALAGYSEGQYTRSNIIFGSSTTKYLSQKGTWENVPTVPSNVSSFNNDAGYLTLSTLPIWDGSVT